MAKSVARVKKNNSDVIAPRRTLGLGAWKVNVIFWRFTSTVPRGVLSSISFFFALVFLLPWRTLPKRRKYSQFSAYNRSRETTNSSAKWCSRKITPYSTNLLLIKCMEAERKNSLSDLMTFNWIKLFFFMRLLVENCFEKMALLRDNHQTTIE